MANANERTPALTEPEEPRARPFYRAHPRAIWLLLGLLIVLAAAGFLLWRHYSVRESTDDARVEANIVSISARVAGRVTNVFVEENQRVEAGAMLVKLDPRDYEVARARAQAELEAARAQAEAARTGVPVASTTTGTQVASARAGVEEARAAIRASEQQVEAARARVEQARAQLRQAQAARTQAEQNLRRYRQLFEKDEVSRQQYEAVVAEADSARAAVDAAEAAVNQAAQQVQAAQAQGVQAQARLAQAESNLKAAGTGPEQVRISKAQAGSAQANVQQKQAAVDQAKLNLEYTNVRAPVAGVVSNKTVQVGHNVMPNQPLLAVVPLQDVWVTAQFKETQLDRMRIGQPASVSVDAYGGRRFDGYVESIGPATGASFSILPPQNTSGNFVKVVQRIPVRIRLRNVPKEYVLRPGMSVVATVLTS